MTKIDDLIDRLRTKAARQREVLDELPLAVRWGVPMSRVPHEELERQGSRNETRWLADHGIPAPLDLAERLWKASPDVAVMTKIILAHRGKT